MHIDKKSSFFAFYAGSKWPFLAFNLFKQDCHVHGKEYKYRTHGGWFMILGALLPLIYQQCPWTWSSGLLFGAILALFTNIITYIAFKNKVDLAIVKATKSAALVPGRKYYMGTKDAEMLIVTLNDVRYLGVAESIKAFTEFTQGKDVDFEFTEQDINTILYHAQNQELDICLITEFGEYILPLEQLLQKQYPDMLDELLKQGKSLYAVVYEDEGSAMYVTANGSHLVTCLEQHVANVFAKPLYQKYEIEPLGLVEIANIIEHANGLAIVDADGMVLYDKSSEELLPMMQRYFQTND